MIQYGEATEAKFIEINLTGTTLGDKSEIEIEFEYQVEDNIHTTTMRTFDMSRLTDTPCKVVLYDPMSPDKSIVMDGLPSSIYSDELTGQFRANPLHCVLPLLAAIVCGEIVAIVVLAVRAF